MLMDGRLVVGFMATEALAARADVARCSVAPDFVVEKRRVVWQHVAIQYLSPYRPTCLACHCSTHIPAVDGGVSLASTCAFTSLASFVEDSGSWFVFFYIWNSA